MAKKVGMSLIIAGEAVDVTHELVSIDDIRLNPENPRIRFQITQRYGAKTPTQAELLDLIRDQPSYDGLHKAIRKAGGIYEPVIVRHDGLVIEGNSRATVYKTLHVGKQDDARWRKIPVMRLPTSVPESAIGLMMASYHVAGKTVWRPYAQAEHIYRLAKIHDLPLAQIADETRMSERDVEYYLDAYSYLVDEVLPQAADGKGTKVLETKFSHALEFVKRKNLSDLRKDKQVRKQLAELIVEDKITGAEVRELDKVIKNRKAKAELNKNGFKAAKKELGKTNPAEASKILKQIQSLSGQLGKMGQGDIELLKTSSTAQSIVIELHDAVKNVAAITGIDLDG